MKNIIGLKIKNIRKCKCLIQEDLICDILNRSTLSKIETGNRLPSLNQLIHISKVLETPLNVLLCEENFANVPSLNNTYLKLKKLYENKKYYNIIDEITPYDFITTYYVGLSYYKLDFKKESEVLLSKCENLFSMLRDDIKPIYVEYLAIAITTLRRLKITSFSSIYNLEYLKKALFFLEMYNMKNCKTYFIIINNIGAYYLYTEEYNAAINYLETFLANNFDIVTLNILSYIHLNLNISYFALKQYDKAIFHIKKAIFFYDYIDNTTQICECYLNHFNALIYENRVEEAYSVINEVLDNFTERDIINGFKCCELILLYNTNNIDLILTKKNSIIHNILSEDIKIDFYYVVAYAYFKKSKFNHALKYYNYCIDYLLTNKRYLDASLAYENMYVITNDDQYKHKSAEYKVLNDKEKYNFINCNITSPCYFLYLDK
ncbi:MAG: helix-turn-helix transcriptional regulator [Clostridium sp.]